MNLDKSLKNTIIDNREAKSFEDIKQWLISYLSELLEVDQDKIDILTYFTSYGLDSAASVVIVGDLENWMERSYEVSLLNDYPTIEKLALHLSSNE
jgi:acyl carrier protein